ncbi:hypothetical protein XELAEV_18033578mg [Xenopus laevis]|uniref:Uncharacterized protein n=1 Tax=Xenopus laevis TaxID=8355 RepID=A0A974CKL6_XENLA|nr:hypothetical protein XELAEV_18033578mg [Xenopus laevis]
MMEFPNPLAHWGVLSTVAYRRRAVADKTLPSGFYHLNYRMTSVGLDVHKELPAGLMVHKCPSVTSIRQGTTT